MKISCTKNNLIKALSLVGGVTGKNINLPILSNVLIKASDNKVEFIATNLDLAVTALVRAKIEEPGSFTVPARTLIDIVNLLPEENIQLSEKGNELIVTCGKTSTKIKGLSADDFPIIPNLPDGKGYLVSAEALKEGLSVVLPAVAKNDIRPELAGVFCYLNTEKKEVVLAATDSYRLAERKIALLQGEEELKIILPARAAQEINHLLGATSEEEENEKNARVLIGDNQIVVIFNNSQIISRLVEGQYPDYTQIIPKQFNITVTVDTEKFIKEMKASGLFTTSGVNSVALGIKSKTGTLEITSTSSQTGEYKSELNADVSGEDGMILLNNRYVLDGVNNFKGNEMQLKIINSDSACVLSPKQDSNYLYIVMPIRQ